MNLATRIILSSGFAIAALTTLFSSPWQVQHVNRYNKPSFTTVEFAPLFDPPTPLSYQSGALISARLDMDILGAIWGATILSTASIGVLINGHRHLREPIK